MQGVIPIIWLTVADQGCIFARVIFANRILIDLRMQHGKETAMASQEATKLIFANPPSRSDDENLWDEGGGETEEVSNRLAVEDQTLKSRWL
jgi:hypothetical protein